jgi:hypothetical protein
MSGEVDKLSLQSAFNYVKGRGLYGAKNLFYYLAIAEMDAATVDSLFYIVLPLVALKTAFNQSEYKPASLMVACLISIITLHLAFKASNDSLFNEISSSIIYAILSSLAGFCGDLTSEYFLGNECQDFTIITTYTLFVDGAICAILVVLMNVVGIRNDYSIQDSFDMTRWNQTIWIAQGLFICYVTCASLMLMNYGAAAKNVAVYFGRFMAYIALSFIQVGFFDYEKFSLVLVLSFLAIIYQLTEALNVLHALDTLHQQVEVTKAMIVLYCNRFALKNDTFPSKSWLKTEQTEELQNHMFQFLDGTGDFLKIDLNNVLTKEDWNEKMTKRFKIFGDMKKKKIEDLSALMKNQMVEEIISNNDAALEIAFDGALVSLGPFKSEESSVSTSTESSLSIQNNNFEDFDVICLSEDSLSLSFTADNIDN